jgi:GT2 family glycosyltransferase/glycosyltransferase involved in cell wall biosynthesis
MVVFVTYSREFGGAERLLVDFASGVATDCVVACPEGPLHDAALAAGLTVFGLRARRLNVRGTIADRTLAPGRLAGHGLELRRLAVNVRPELVVAWGMRSAIACTLLASMPCPVAFQHNDLPSGRLVGGAVRAAARRADLVTVPSRAVAAQIDPRGQLAHRLRVVSPGVDVDRFRDAPPTQPAEVLVLGALVRWKRPDLALEAIAIARRTLPELRVRLVGAPLGDDGTLLGELRERAARDDLANAVEFAGAVADPRPDLARATCLLHCADAEPFGIAVLEALASGRPAVVPAAAGPAEIVDETCGVFYPPGDARAAAEAIVAVASDPHRSIAMGAAGRERARQRFGRTAARAAYRDALGVRASRQHRAAAELALVTVTYNSASHLRRLLQSASLHLPEARVVVVDCASSDDTLAVAHAHRSATIIALEQNVGFGAANNRGLEHVTESVTVLVNPDVELIDDSLVVLAAQLRDRSRPDRLLAPLVLSADGSRQDTVHPLPGSAADLLGVVAPPRAVPGTSVAPWGATTPRAVGWAVGCALVARTATLSRLGPFDERIFMYGEDLDLGLRAASEGIETWFCPDARVLHHRAHSSQSAFGGEPFELLARARHEVVERRLGRRRANVDDAAQAATFASRIVSKRLLGRPALRERRQLEALLRVRRADGRA